MQQQITNASAWLRQHAALQTLAPLWDSATQLLQRVQEEQDACDQALQQQQTLPQQLSEAQQQQQDAHKALALQEAQFQEARQKRDEQQRRLQEADAEQLQRRVRELHADLQQLHKVRDGWHRLCQDNRRLQQQQEKQTEISDTLQQLAQREQVEAQQLALAQAQLQQAEAMQAKAQHSIAGHALRASLREGEPCPVCGGKQHPWRKKAPADDPLQALQDGLEEEVQRCRQAWQNSQHTQAQSMASLHSLQQQLHALREEAEFLAREAEQTRAAWQTLLEDSPLAQEVEQQAGISSQPEQAALQLLLQREQHWQAMLQEAQLQEEALQDAQKQLHRQQQNMEDASEQLQQLRTLAHKAEQEAHRLQQRHAEAAQRLQEAEQRSNACRAEAEQFFAPLLQSLPQLAERNGLPHLPRCHALLEESSQRQQQLQAWQQQAEPLQESVQQLQTRLQQDQARLQTMQQQLQQSQQESLSLQQQLQALFPQENWQQCEKRLQGAVSAARKQGERLQQQLQEITTQHAAAQARHEELQRQLQLSDEASNEAAQQLAEWLQRWNEESEQPPLDEKQLSHWLQCDEDWIRQRQAELQALEKCEQEAQTVLRERRQQRDQQLAQLARLRCDLRALPPEEADAQGQGLLPEVTAPPLWRSEEAQPAHDEAQSVRRQQDISEAQRSINHNRELKRKEIARLQTKLASDEQCRQRAQQIQQQLDAQQAVWQRWAALNELIGSQNGKKFRDYAQQFTLDLLLSHANLHLQQIGRRYRLERIPDSLTPLVLDLDMGEEKRSVHSLSGGETFLVSLALALALASLSSSRVRVESLFIDEGFGSLDAHTLQVAMDALDRLQAQGRKVGVISHVQEMTERIGVRIQVSKGSAGRSTLQVLG